MQRTILTLCAVMFLVLTGAIAHAKKTPVAELPECDLYFDDFEPKPVGTTYYVSATGNDSSNGKTTTTAWKSIQYAVNTVLPGDTIYVMNGTYTKPGQGATVAYISKSGTPTAWIMLKAYPGHCPVIKVDGHWGGITVGGAKYILIDGLTVQGNSPSITLEYALAQKNNLNNPLTSANGISITNEGTVFPHHIIVRNCTVFDCPGGGISTKHADYVRIDNNTVHANSFYSPYANSGISMYLNSNYDLRPVFKMYVRDNVSYGNRNFIPGYYSGNDPLTRVITDGNGIIIDDTMNIQSPFGPIAYLGKTLVENNLTTHNGGRGILVYLAENVTVKYNETRLNAQSPSIPADSSVNASTKITFVQNIIEAPPNKDALEVTDTSNSRIRANTLVE